MMICSRSSFWFWTGKGHEMVLLSDGCRTATTKAVHGDGCGSCESLRKAVVMMEEEELFSFSFFRTKSGLLCVLMEHHKKIGLPVDTCMFFTFGCLQRS